MAVAGMILDRVSPLSLLMLRRDLQVCRVDLHGGLEPRAAWVVRKTRNR